MADTYVISPQERESLVDKLRHDVKYRELMKKDWKKAFGEAGIDPNALVGKNVEYSETVPLKTGPVTAGIIITITAARGEEVKLNDSVLFTK